MGKQGSPKSPRPTSKTTEQSLEMKDYQLRFSETSVGYNDPSLGRRVSWGEYQFSRAALPHGMQGDHGKIGSYKGVYSGGKKPFWFQKHLRSLALTIGLMGLIFLLDSAMLTISDMSRLHNRSSLVPSSSEDKRAVEGKKEQSSVVMYERLLNLASSSLTEKDIKPERNSLWIEPQLRVSAWKPCADRKGPEILENPQAGHNGFILVSANGGLNQQRVAVCNSVAVASMLNATLVIPKFLYSNVWNDPSQFGDIYQEDFFINMLKNEVTIVKDLPEHLRSIDLEAIGSVITDSDLVKEATPSEYMKLVLPVLQRNGVVHFLGYGNRLGFDPIPSHIQKLRCKCNFHALKYAPKIQEVGSLLVRRIRKYEFSRNKLDKELLGDLMPESHSGRPQSHSRYLALHLRFEEDMVAYSLCDFGGGETEGKELQTYRETHFPLLLERLKKLKPVTPTELRLEGRCPLTPEEASLVLAGLGFNRRTYIYLAGSQIYGGQSRMRPFTRLYPNLITKEDLLSPSEIEPFRNFSSQLAALDFIACATSDVFAMTDTGSQLSSLVSGFRTYFGGGNAPTLRPNKKRLATIMLENGTIGWSSFEDRVRRMFDEGKRVQLRGYGRSVYRLPRSPECMCKSH